MSAHTERLQRLEQALHEHVQAWRFSPGVEVQQAWRGGQGTVAVPLVAAMGDLTRFASPREFMNCLGLVPSEYASGAQRRQGASTKAGNRHARRVLAKAPGPIALPLKSADISHDDWQNRPKSARTAVGKPRFGSVNAPGVLEREANLLTWSP